VTDLAGVIDAATKARIAHLVDELRDRTGAEIAVVTVETTAPLDDFTYAMRLADAWKPGRKREDTGVVFLVATRDRKVRVLVGYGLEGILPDGLVGEIIDREVLPAFRAGQVADGIWRGVTEIARTVAAARGVTLGTAPPRPARQPPPSVPSWPVLLVLLLVVAIMLYQASRPSRFRRERGSDFPFWWGGGGFGDGGFGGGGGGFGGFGGGSFGGGGAGRSW
jgi:uncharacterized protein